MKVLLQAFLTPALVGSGKIYAPAALPPGKEPPDMRLGGTQSQSGRDGEK
jgi:hypothetical protein